MQVKTYMLVGAGIFCAATLIRPLNAFADTGNDHRGKKCEKIMLNGSSTYGNCEEICDKLDVTKKDEAGSARLQCKEPPPKTPSSNSGYPLTFKGNEMVFHPVTIKRQSANAIQ